MNTEVFIRAVRAGPAGDPSGTEPVIRVTGEGDDKTLVEAVVDDSLGVLTDVAA